VELAGTTAVVTGGASGIGRGTALELARRGADVVLADLHDERLADTASAVTALGRRCLPVRCDVTLDDDVDALADAAFAEFGTVDLLMNNAGIAVLGPSYRVAMDDWQRILDVNVLGLVRGVRAFVPAMVERGHGYVVNTASIAGIWAYSWDCAPYITSKFAAYGYSEALARSLLPLGVGVSVLCPGLVHTNLGEHARMSGVPDEHASSWINFPSDMAADAVDADAVGPMVCDAVEAGRFTIFTNDHDAERYTTWRTDIDASLAAANAAAPTPPRIVGRGA
jgi:NAD(P)-dependent dehydrogenase (short-subunit alcohol dehydrogenase family)